LRRNTEGRGTSNGSGAGAGADASAGAGADSTGVESYENTALNGKVARRGTNSSTDDVGAGTVTPAVVMVTEDSYVTLGDIVADGVRCSSLFSRRQPLLATNPC
jgi:hypothetical protein